ncbi:cyclophane-forming radical SAM peptide maturase AmcB [Kitasatospora sp. NPDC004745]|uniref:cyclophane-forming radical SAM peptide maturase AmcB n=1 Tax=Kitasatospora sp. NPDC004745 TaxID=3364019 RepID=UPI00367587C5
MNEPRRYDRRLARRPQTVVVQPTSFCNLDCTYCYLPHRDRRNHMTVEVASAVADSLAEFAGRDPDRPLDVVWHAGEPLTLGVRRFAELLAPFEPLRRAGLVHHYVQTNATLVTDAWCDFLTAHRFRVGVSIDGPATLNAQRIDRRGKAAFDRIVKGIARLRAAGIAFSVIAVVTTDSIGHPEELLEFLARLGCHSIGINIEEAEGISLTRPLPTIEQAGRFWRRTIAWSRLNPAPSVRELARLGDYLHTLRTGEQADRSAFLIDPIPTISTTGDVVLLSPELAGVSAPDYDDFRAGNVLRQSLASMLDDADRLRYVDEFLTGLERCEATCQFFDFCRGAQAGNRYFENGRLDTTETNYCRVSRQALITALSDTVREERAA